MKLILSLLALSSGLFGQIRAGCTPDSLTVAQAMPLNIAGVWEYSCYAQNIGTTVQTLSVSGFALDFIELAQIQPPDVLAIYTQKQARTGWAKAALVAEVVGVGALAVMSQNYFTVGVKAAEGVGLATYGSTKAGEYFTTKIPSITNAVSGMLTQDQILQPGTSFTWKLYASNNITPPVQNPLGLARASRPARLSASNVVHPVVPVRILTVVTAPATRTELQPVAPMPNLLRPPAPFTPTVLTQDDAVAIEANDLPAPVPAPTIHATYTPVMSASKPAPAVSGDSAELLRFARSEMRAGWYRAAINDLSQAVQSDPNCERCWSELAYARRVAVRK